MNKYKKPDIDEDKIKNNPFLKKLVVPVNRISSSDKWKQDGEEWYKGSYDFDADQYTKVFSNSNNRLAINALSARAKELLMWVVCEVEKGKHYVWINKKRYMEELGIGSMNTYRNALNELIEQSFLMKTTITDVLWINPTYFFNGNRIKSFPENVKIK